MTDRNQLAEGQEAKARERKPFHRGVIIEYTKAIREQVRLDAAVEIAIELVRRAKEDK